MGSFRILEIIYIIKFPTKFLKFYRYAIKNGYLSTDPNINVVDPLCSGMGD